MSKTRFATTSFAAGNSRPYSPRTQTTPAYNATPAPGSQLYNSPEWIRLRIALMDALQNFPEARESVIRALRQLSPPEDAHAPHH